MRQFKRFYKLTIGNYKSRDALFFTDLQISFDIHKSADNSVKSNNSSIKITNLSDSSLKLLETDYPAAILEVGYESEDNLKILFAGKVTEVTTEKSGADRITELLIGASYTTLNHEAVSKLVPAGSTVKTVVEELIKEFPEIKKGVYNVKNLDTILRNGYSLSGTLRSELNRLAKNYRLSWQVDNDILYISDSDRATSENFESAFVISPSSGLIEIPYRTSGKKNKMKKDKDKKQGVQFKMLINPEVPVGGIIKLEDTEINGWFRVDTLKYSGEYRGGDWVQEVFCTSLEKVSKSG